jgi:hypothetical protein
MRSKKGKEGIWEESKKGGSKGKKDLENVEGK